MTTALTPNRPSAPLPPSATVAMPGRGAMMAEIRRAAAELMWALHRQRAAWDKLARTKAALGERNIEFVDNERPYKLAVSDVQWWRGEVSSRANALSALLAAVRYFDDQADQAE